MITRSKTREFLINDFWCKLPWDASSQLDAKPNKDRYRVKILFGVKDKKFQFVAVVRTNILVKRYSLIPERQAIALFWHRDRLLAVFYICFINSFQF